MNNNESISLNHTTETLMGRVTGSYHNISGNGGSLSGSDSAAPSVMVPSNSLLAGHSCQNLTRLFNELFLSLSTNLSGDANGPGAKSSKPDESQRHAVVYIVVVLFFYSFGIGLMMIKYMRKEAKEQEECKMYRRYINAAHEQYLNSTNRARLANRLALQALNTVNAIPQTTQLGSKVTFV